MSEGVRGASWEDLGGLAAILEGILRQDDFWSIVGSIWGSFWVPKGGKMEPKRDQKQIKIEGKNDDEKRNSSRSSWGRLGAILGRLG